ncbi:hypothetical protein [Methylobacterium mesophilicum]
MADNSSVPEVMAADKIVVLDRAILEAMSLRETIFEIDEAELTLMIDILLFRLGQAAADCVRPPTSKTAMRKAA